MNDEDIDPMAPTLKSASIRKAFDEVGERNQGVFKALAESDARPPEGTWFTTNKPNRCFWCGAWYPDAFALSSTTAQERVELKAKCMEFHTPGCIHIPVISLINGTK